MKRLGVYPSASYEGRVSWVVLEDHVIESWQEEQRSLDLDGLVDEAVVCVPPVRLLQCGPAQSTEEHRRCLVEAGRWHQLIAADGYSLLPPKLQEVPLDLARTPSALASLVRTHTGYVPRGVPSVCLAAAWAVLHAAGYLHRGLRVIEGGKGS